MGPQSHSAVVGLTVAWFLQRANSKKGDFVFLLRRALGVPPQTQDDENDSESVLMDAPSQAPAPKRQHTPRREHEKPND